MANVTTLNFDRKISLDEIWFAYRRSKFLDVEIHPGNSGSLLSPYWGPNSYHLSKTKEGGAGVGQRIYFGEEYDRTLMAWRENLVKNRHFFIDTFGIHKYRKYFYLFSSCAGGFRSKRMTVGQWVLSPSDLRETYKPVRLSA